MARLKLIKGILATNNKTINFNSRLSYHKYIILRTKIAVQSIRSWFLFSLDTHTRQEWNRRWRRVCHEHIETQLHCTEQGPAATDQSEMSIVWFNQSEASIYLTTSLKWEIITKHNGSSTCFAGKITLHLLIQLILIIN